jgi:hypothetical protein
MNLCIVDQLETIKRFCEDMCSQDCGSEAKDLFFKNMLCAIEASNRGVVLDKNNSPILYQTESPNELCASLNDFQPKNGWNRSLDIIATAYGEFKSGADPQEIAGLINLAFSNEKDMAHLVAAFDNYQIKASACDMDLDSDPLPQVEDLDLENLEREVLAEIQKEPSNLIEGDDIVITESDEEEDKDVLEKEYSKDEDEAKEIVKANLVGVF